MPVPFLNQTTGQLEFYSEQDLTPETLPLLAARGLRQATPEDVANRERTIEYSSVGQQALAQAERVVRGATLGQVEGIGSEEDIRARAEVSADVSPVTSLVADFAPDIGLGILTGGGSALLTTAGRTAAKGLGRAALSAAVKAAPRAALAGEALAGGLVTASQQAFQENRQFFHENPVEDATNTLLWTGIGGVLGGAPEAFKALKATGKAGKAAAEVADEAELLAARASGEANAVPMPASAGPSTAGVPLTSDEGTQAAYAAGLEARPVVGEPKSGVGLKEAAGAAGLTAAGVLGADGQTEGAAGAAAAGLAFLFPKGLMKGKSEAFQKMARIVGPIPADKLDMEMMTRIAQKAEKELTDPAEYGEFMGKLNDHFDNPKASFQQQPGGEIDYLKEQTGSAGGATRGGMFRGSDGKERYVKFMPEQKALNEVGNSRAYEAFGVPSVKLKDEPLSSAAGSYATEGGRSRMVMSDKFGSEWSPLDKLRSQDGAVTDEMARSYVQGVPADIVLGNWDVSKNGANIITDGKAALRIDVGEAGPNSVKFSAKDEWKNLEDGFTKATGGMGAAPNMDPADMVRAAGIDKMNAVKGELTTGVSNIESALTNAGGSLPFVKQTWPHLPAAKAASLAKQLEKRLAFVKENVDKIALVTLMGIGAASSEDSGGAAMAGVGLLGLFLGGKGLMGKGLKSMAEESVERLGAKEGKAMIAAERGVAKAERNAVRSQADDIVKRAAKGEEPLSRVDGFLRDSRLAQYQPEIIDVATKEMRNDLNELNRLSQGIRERAVKQEDVAKNIADNLPAQQAKARDIALVGQRLAGEMRIEAQQLGQQLGKKGPAYFSGTARDLVSSLIERTEAISHMSNGAEIFNALDDLKRVVDNHKVALESGARKSTKDPIRYQELVPKVEAFAHQIRASLEDVPTFGRAGEMQRAYNATYHNKWFPAKQVFEDSVFRRTGRDYKAFDTLDAWESKVTGLLENAGTGERRHVNDMLGALKEMAEQRAKYGTAPKAETDRIASLVNKIERTFKLADDASAAKERLQVLMPAAQVAGSGIGAAVGGLPGAIMGGAVAKGATELATGKYRRALMAMRGATEETVEKSVDDWIQVSKGRAAVSGAKRSRFPKLELTPENRHLLQTAKRMGVTFGFAEFLGDNNDPQSAFSTKRDALLDDEGFVNRFADEFGDLAQEEPQVYAVAAGKAGEIRKFLLDRLPSSVAVSMARPNGYPPTNEAIEDWSVYWNAATNPRSVVQSMSRGDIRPQEVETLRTLYRPLYEKLQATLIDKISNATNMGDDLDDQFVMRMSLLFDLDGAGTPAFSQRAAAIARQVTPAQPPQQGKPFAPKAGARVSPSNVAITGPTYGSIG